MDDGKGTVETPPAPTRSPRNGAIELLQVLSLLMIPVALLLPNFRTQAIWAAALLGIAPFGIVTWRAFLAGRSRQAPASETPEPAKPLLDPELRHS